MKSHEQVVDELVQIVQTMIDESGRPERFDARQWVASWINQPLPALGGRSPAEFCDTPGKLQMIKNMLRSAQSGAYW